MHVLLIHSPLIGDACWSLLADALRALGCRVTIPSLNNRVIGKKRLYEHHLAQIDLAVTAVGDPVDLVVGHSGAGVLLPLIPANRASYVFLDAIFPDRAGSRFDWFDDRAAVGRWRNLAVKHGGCLPKSELMPLSRLLPPGDIQHQFLQQLSDVPIDLYEERLPTDKWQLVDRACLYLQWSSSYAEDAARARRAGLQVVIDSASHFHMTHQPEQVARQLVAFGESGQLIG